MQPQPNPYQVYLISHGESGDDRGFWFANAPDATRSLIFSVFSVKIRGQT
jgi:hypothetical protein